MASDPEADHDAPSSHGLPPGEHASVLRDEVLAWLRPRPTGRYVDATLGNAGHAIALLEAAPDTTVLGLDADPAALDVARARLGRLAERATLVHANFRDLASVARASGFADVDGIVMDLGLSSRQLDVAGRGFSFRRDEPLDMRLDPTHGESAAELLRHADEADIADILYQYGEEHRSRRVARAIVQRRERSPIETTQDLVQAVEAALGPKRGRIHPATRTFQALRIAVNGELAALDAVLPQAAALLGARGRLAVISFHSLEDRRVKWFFRNGGPEQAPLSELTRKPVVPSEAELQANPRARSAKLRIAERIDPAVERPESHPDWWARRRRDRGPS